MAEVDLSHSIIYVHCPTCGAFVQDYAFKLKDHPERFCEHCETFFVAEDMERNQKILEGFWQQVKDLGYE